MFPAFCSISCSSARYCCRIYERLKAEHEASAAAAQEEERLINLLREEQEVRWTRSTVFIGLAGKRSSPASSIDLRSSIRLYHVHKTQGAQLRWCQRRWRGSGRRRRHELPVPMPCVERWSPPTLRSCASR